MTHSPPSDLVMKNQNWPIGDRIRTVLISAEEQVSLVESASPYIEESIYNGRIEDTFRVHHIEQQLTQYNRITRFLASMLPRLMLT